METAEIKALVKARVWKRECRQIAIVLPVSLIVAAIITVMVPPRIELLPLEILDGIVGASMVLGAMSILSAIDYRRRLTVLRELRGTMPPEPKPIKSGAKAIILTFLATGVGLSIVGGNIPNHFCLLGAITLILFGVGFLYYEKSGIADGEEMALIKRLSG